MGNCINHSQPTTFAAATARNQGRLRRSDKPASATEDERTVRCCDASSVNDTLSSPPASPASSERSKAAATSTNGIMASAHAPIADGATASCGGSGGRALLPLAAAEMEARHREEGQARLRHLVVSGAESGDIDWKAVISVAEDLHRRERAMLLRSYDGKRRLGGGGSGVRGRQANIATRIVRGDGAFVSGVQPASRGRRAFFGRGRHRREMAGRRRRRLDSVGSFSVNLALYDDEGGGGVRSDLQSPLDVDDATRTRTITRTCTKDRNEPTAYDASTAVIDDSDDEGVDVFEDDELSEVSDVRMLGASSRSATCARSTTPTRPATPAPITIPIRTASFLAATSLLNSNVEDDIDEESSSESSNDDSSLEGITNWDLMTIEEDTTVADW